MCAVDVSSTGEGQELAIRPSIRQDLFFTARDSVSINPQISRQRVETTTNLPVFVKDGAVLLDAFLGLRRADLKSLHAHLAIVIGDA